MNSGQGSLKFEYHWIVNISVYRSRRYMRFTFMDKNDLFIIYIILLISIHTCIYAMKQYIHWTLVYNYSEILNCLKMWNHLKIYLSIAIVIWNIWAVVCPHCLSDVHPDWWRQALKPHRLNLLDVGECRNRTGVYIAGHRRADFSSWQI